MVDLLLNIETLDTQSIWLDIINILHINFKINHFIHHKTWFLKKDLYTFLSKFVIFSS